MFQHSLRGVCPTLSPSCKLYSPTRMARVYEPEVGLKAGQEANRGEASNYSMGGVNLPVRIQWLGNFCRLITLF